MLCEESHFSIAAISQPMYFHWYCDCGALIAQSLRVPDSSTLCTDLTSSMCVRNMASMLRRPKGQQVLHSEGNSESITTTSDEGWKWGDPPFEAQAIPRQKFKTEVLVVTQKLILMSSKNIFQKRSGDSNKNMRRKYKYNLLCT